MSDLIEEARDLARLICPFPEQLDDGDVVERMPDDLLRAAVMLGSLCDLLTETATALQDCRNAMHADNPADGWLEIIQRADAAIAKLRGAT